MAQVDVRWCARSLDNLASGSLGVQPVAVFSAYPRSLSIPPGQPCKASIIRFGPYLSPFYSPELIGDPLLACLERSRTGCPPGSRRPSSFFGLLADFG